MATKGTLTVDPKKNKYTLYGDIDPVTGKQTQTGGSTVPNAEYIVSGGQVLGKNPNYNPNPVPASTTTQYTGSPGDIAEQKALEEAANMSPEQKAQFAYEAERKGVAEQTESLGLVGPEDKPYAITIQEQADQLAAKQKADRDYQLRQQALDQAYQQSQLERLGRQGEASIAGTVADMAQSREGIISSTKPQVAEKFKAELQTRIGEATNRLQAAQQQRTQVMSDLAQAQLEKRYDLVRGYQADLAQADTELQRRQMEADDLSAKLSQEERLTKQQEIDQTQAALEQGNKEAAQSRLNTETTQKIFDSMGTAITGLTTEQLSQMIDGTNFTLPMALTYQAAVELEAEAAQTKDALEANKLRLEAQKMKKDIQFVGKPTEVQEFEYYSSLTPAQKTEYNNLKTTGDFQLVKGDDGTIHLLNRKTGGLKTLAAPGETIDWDPTTFNIGEEVGWCGDYASTLSTATTVGDNWIDKRQAIDDKNITVGDKLLIPLGVSKDKGFGHVAVVLGYDPTTGEIQVAESNKDGRQSRQEGLGVATFGTYNVNDLNNQFKDDWGVAHGELKEPYASAETYKPKEKSALAQVDKDLRTAVTTKANQFDGEQIVKDFQTAQSGRNFVKSIPSNTISPSDDIGFIYAFAKIMDPNSVVREGEYATVQKYSQSWAESFGFNAARVFSNTKFLSEDAIDKMKGTIESKYAATKRSYDQARSQYIKSINNIAGKPVGEQLLQDYTVEEEPIEEMSDEELYHSVITQSDRQMWDELSEPTPTN